MYASPGVGTSPHIAMERLFKITYGLDVVQVPFQGGGPAVASTLGGHTHILHITLPLVAEHIKQGKLRGLAVAAKDRSPALPDVPTLAEAGIPHHEVGYWTGVLVPAGTPNEIVAYLNRQIATILSRPEVREGSRQDRLRHDGRHAGTVCRLHEGRNRGMGPRRACSVHQDRMSGVKASSIGSASRCGAHRPSTKEGV
jgi:tripartite-type tricarboxylate transporter receptor subunit TctC